MHRRGKLSLPGWESSQGENHRQAILTEAAVRDIRTSTEPRAKLAKKYGIAVSYVGDIKRRRRWGHVV